MDCSDPDRSAVAGLPDDALVEIFSRLPVKALLRSKCVCKAWHDIIADPLHRRRLAQTLLGFLYGGGDGDINLLWTSFPFPKVELSGVHDARLLGTCNGLALLEFGDPATLCYVVCNPATGQWAAVPGNPAMGQWAAVPSDPAPLDYFVCSPATGQWAAVPGNCPASGVYLFFDPSVSSHFHIIMFLTEGDEISANGEFLVTVHAYSSRTGRWRSSETDWSLEERQGEGEGWRHGDCIIRSFPSAFVHGSLYLVTRGCQILEVDAEGKTRRIIPMPLLFRVAALDWDTPRNLLYLGQSQGHLHVIDCDSSEMSVWVHENYDAQEWVLKHSVSLSHLFGGTRLDSRVIGIHPDDNSIFILQRWDRQLISYRMDSKELHPLGTIERDHVCFAPYVRCFVDFSDN